MDTKHTYSGTSEGGVKTIPVKIQPMTDAEFDALIKSTLHKDTPSDNQHFSSHTNKQNVKQINQIKHILCTSYFYGYWQKGIH